MQLNERENKFIEMIYDHTGSDVTQFLMGGDLYQIAERMGFNKYEVGSISDMLSGLGLLQRETYKGDIDGKPASVVAYVKITSHGVLYARSLE